jgi:mRNA interferase RelE/StbE
MVSGRRTTRRLRVPDDTAALVRSLHPQLKRKIKAACKRIVDDPEEGKPLRANLRGLKSLRVGHFRIVYRIASEKVVEIITIGPRRTIYEETYRIIKKAKP